MEPEFIEIEDNFIPDIVSDPYRRIHIRTRFNIKEGQTREQVEAACEQYIKEYIQKNTTYHSPLYTKESLPPEPAVLPSIQKEKPLEEMSFEEQIMSCTDIKVLESYKLLAKKNAFFQSIYNKRFLDLKKTGDATKIGFGMDVSKIKIGVCFYDEAGRYD